MSHVWQGTLYTKGFFLNISFSQTLNYVKVYNFHHRNSFDWIRFKSTVRASTRCSLGWKVTCPFHQTIVSPWWPTQSSLFGSRSKGQTWLGTSKSSSLTREAQLSSGTPKSIRLHTFQTTLTNSLDKCKNISELPKISIRQPWKTKCH